MYDEQLIHLLDLLEPFLEEAKRLGLEKQTILEFVENVVPDDA